MKRGRYYLAYHSVDVGHVEANAGQEVADRVHDEDRIPADKWSVNLILLMPVIWIRH